MRNNIFFKLLAVILCAASLMGAVGAAAGALVLVEGDLYNKTVDQMLNEKFQSDARIFAEQTALSYASRELGGCPEDMTQRYGVYFPYHYGYSILDAEGTSLCGWNLELKEHAEVYTIPVSGQYMHLVSTETESQQKETEAQKRLAAEEATAQEMPVPREGIALDHVFFTDSEGHILYEAFCDGYTGQSTYFYRDYLLENGVVDSFANSYQDHMGKYTGFLFYNAAGQMSYTSFLEEHESPFTATVYGVNFHNAANDFSFHSTHPEGIGTLSNEQGTLTFTSFYTDFPAADEEPLSTEATIETVTEELPATEESISAETDAAPTEEAAPAETEDVTEEAPAETQAAETEAPVEETIPSSASAVPEDGEQEPAEVSTEETLPPETQVAETQPPETLPPETQPAETVPAETIPEEPEPELINGRPVDSYQINRTEYHNQLTGERTTAKFIYLPLPEMTVEVYIDRDSVDNAEVYNVLRLVRQYRQYLLPAIGICLLVFFLTLVYLCTAAGRKPKCDAVRAGGLNRLPLDLYLGILVFVGAAVIAIIGVGAPALLERDFLLGCTTAAVSCFVCCLLVTGVLFAFIAQLKTPGGFWWRNLLCIRFVFLCMRFLRWLEACLRESLFPRLFLLLKKTWDFLWRILVRLYTATEHVTSRTGQKLNRFFSLIPMTWQWLLGGFTIILFSLLVNTHHILLILIGILVPIAIVLYATHCFGILSESAKRMGKGDLNTKVEDRLMVGCFKNFAEDLNDLADVAVVAAQNQLKSERMKTELITNVSHDIKTPLTSIINYVDLLQKPHTEEETDQYLEVLDRQSQRLKKLVEDLMDMSKASTGNMAVEITRVDAVESVNQALGEFADKLEQARLYPVFRHKEDRVPIMADGKLVWRVLSNLLSNAVKYGMPGTRIYLDLLHVNDKVIISLKNISREELNITAEELMERFVRGDVSRNTEGSGLGLNIAKSLMELQKGNLQLLVDGDLFKVTLIFPDAK